MFCVLSERSLADIYVEVVCGDWAWDGMISAYFIEQQLPLEPTHMIAQGE